MLQTILVKTIAVLILTEILWDPRVPVQELAYPSGVREMDKFYETDKPSKDYPLFKFDMTAYDSAFNKLEPGIYPVEYSPQENMLLIDRGDVIVRSPVFQVIQTKQKVYLPSVEVAFVKNKKVFIIYKNENLEVQSFLYLPEAVLGND